MEKGLAFGSILILIVVLGVVSVLLIAPPIHSLSYSANDTITINVSVRQVTLVDINPSNLTWTDVPPGGVGDSSKEAHNYSGIWIENIGSVNITKAWLANTYWNDPTNKGPFGTGNASLYDPANMVVVSLNETDPNQPFQFINRVEYPDSNRYSGDFYIRFDSGAKWGRFRNTSYEYFWEVVPGASGNCSNGTLVISTVPHTQQQTGTVDLTTSNPDCVNQPTGSTTAPCRKVTLTTLSSYNGDNSTLPSGVYGVAEISIGQGDLPRYCFAIKDDCNLAVFVKWNADFVEAARKAGACTLNPYLFDGSSNPDQVLVPGEIFHAFVRVYVPYGVPYGTIGSATPRQVRVYVSA